MKKLITLFAILTTVTAFGNTKKEMALKNGGKLIVTETGEGSLRNTKLELVGNSQTRTVELKDIDPISDVKVTDLNGDGTEEIFLVTTNAGSGSYGTLYGYSSKALAPIKVPEIKNDKGYMGHDVFTFEAKRILRSHPIYKEGDSNANPTGGKFSVGYTLGSDNTLSVTSK